MGKVEITGFWTFFCNPKHWPIELFLKNIPDVCESQYRIATWQKDYYSAGQMGVIRVGTDSRSIAQLKGERRLERGIYAVVEIIGSPRREKRNGFKIEGERNGADRFNVPIKYIRNYISSPVLLTTLERDFIIKQDHYLLKGIQAASMPLLEDTFNRILLYGEES